MHIVYPCRKSLIVVLIVNFVIYSESVWHNNVLQNGLDQGFGKNSLVDSDLHYTQCL